MNVAPIVIPKSVPAARKALAEMEIAIDSAETYAELRHLERRAEAIKALYREYELVKQDAERVVLVARHRTGEELRAAPANHGGDRRSSSAQNNLIPTLAQQVGSPQRGVRLKQLAEATRDEMLSAAARLWEAGKEATQTAVLRVLQGEAKERRAEREAALGEKQKALPNKRYGVIYADPPWAFRVYSQDTGTARAADSHYSTMPVEKIAEIPVASIAARDCVLFLWTTSATLAQAFWLLNEWGFEYKSQCIWLKPSIMLGFWFRSRHEILLVATKGNVPAPAHGTQWASVVEAPRGRHSEKPALFYELIEAYFPSLPKIELFARVARANWDRWGNEAPPTDEAAA